ncbi:MAG: polyprenyl synthetase family protein [Pirellulales bacterium]
MQVVTYSTSTSTSAVQAELSRRRHAVEEALDRFTVQRPGCPERLSQAIRYSLLAPGKRLRPLLVLFAAEAAGGSWQDAIPAACAVEMIHAYSLIHDDLPAMDNDDLRRGQPTCHRKFDEATAILAGDALQMAAVEVIAEYSRQEVVGACCLALARAAGAAELVGGQADDLAAEGRFGGKPFGDSPERKLAFLQNIHRRKTGAMIAVWFEAQALAVGAENQVADAHRNIRASNRPAFQCSTIARRKFSRRVGRHAQQG